ncbi:MAG: hypothetical protein M3460_05430 [Actinomycetota bacterium]|nr:hypothetical protein [Actinomycetota bacterium]
MDLDDPGRQRDRRRPGQPADQLANVLQWPARNGDPGSGKQHAAAHLRTHPLRGVGDRNTASVGAIRRLATLSSSW